MLWIYKCNSRGREYQRAVGDWSDFFISRRAQQWGSTEYVPELKAAKVGDRIIAYQTDTNELVGIARVVQWQRRGAHEHLILRPVAIIGVKVRPLKKAHPSVAGILALQPGPIRTLYPITQRDARTLLGAASARLQGSPATHEPSDASMHGAGFGTAVENRRVEKAAIKHVRDRLKRGGWQVQDVSREKPGYDLLCRRRDERFNLEVKGARGEAPHFIITTREHRLWRLDRRFRLAFVGNALTADPNICYFNSSDRPDFALTPLAYTAKRRPNKRLKLTGALK